MSSLHTFGYKATCPLANFRAVESGREIHGIDLAYLVDKSTATLGETLKFTIWVLNATAHTLTDINIQLRSFTNEQMQPLQFLTRPTDREMTGRTLLPGRSLNLALTYMVDSADLEYEGLIISALQAELTSPEHGLLRSECDAWTFTTPARALHMKTRISAGGGWDL